MDSSDDDESIFLVQNLLQNFRNKLRQEIYDDPVATLNDLSMKQSPTASAADLLTLLKSTQLQLKDSMERGLELERSLNAIKADYQNEVSLRKQFHEENMNLKGNIRVFLRIRPSLSAFSELPTVRIVPVSFLVHEPTERRFEFDACIDQHTLQADIFEAHVAPFVVSFMDGVNVTLVAYGQTGSGKTFTMEGTRENPGMYFRSLHRAFELAQRQKNQTPPAFKLSILQIYNDTLLDLLDTTTQTKLEIVTQTGLGKNAFVRNLSQVLVTSALQAEDILRKASMRRKVGAHALNETSSRSHLVLMLDSDEARLTFIDLAGSERLKTTEVSSGGDRLKESQFINKSLSALGEVLHSLQDKNKSHHPFRNSKLTFLLQHSLSGNAKVAFFACVSPDHVSSMETFHTLTFAERIRKVELSNKKL